MLTLSIILFVFAVLIAWLGAVGTISVGAYAFAFGFLVIATIAGLSFWRGHPRLT